MSNEPENQFDPEVEPLGEGVEETPSPEGEIPVESSSKAGEDTIGEHADDDEVEALKSLVAERTEDLQRLQAEYVNYKKRVDRDRALARQAGVEAVVSDLMPVLDAVALARSHSDLEGGFKLVAEELEKLGTKYGLARFGEVGEVFDPTLHDALMQVPMPEPVEVATVSQVVQPGYRLGERVIRPARVAVAQPSE